MTQNTSSGPDDSNLNNEQTQPDTTQPMPPLSPGQFIPWRPESASAQTPGPGDREAARQLERERIDDVTRASALLRGIASLTPAPHLPMPSERTPTPPFRPAPPTAGASPPPPLERLAAARRTPDAASRRGGTDGSPGPLPLAFAGGGAAVVSGKVRQRFSGSGLAPRSRVQRLERRARRSTLVMALLAVLVILSSALLLFNPFIQQAGFGFGVGQRFKTVDSSQTLFLHGNPPTVTPTTTPPATPSPTPNASHSGGPAKTPTVSPESTPRPRPTPAPTATPTPKPTPAPTPTPPPPTNAVVTFTATTQTISNSPGTMTACNSGCTFGLTNGSGSTSGSATVNATGTIYYYAYGSLYVTVRGVIFCYTNGACHSYSGPFPGSNLTFTSGGFVSGSCTLYVPQTGVSHSVTVGKCYFTQNIVNQNQYNGSVGYCQDHTSYEICWSLSWYNLYANGGTGPMVTSTDCANAQSKAYTISQNNANSQLQSWAGSRVIVTRSVSTQKTGCSPQPGTAASSVTGYAKSSWSAGVFNPQTAVNAVDATMSQKLPSSYYWSAGPSGCTTASSVQNSVSGGVDHITCVQSGTARYDWRATSTQQTYAAKLAGLSYQQALQFCNNPTSSPGVVSGSCSITLGAGNASLMPTSASQITLVIK